MKRSLHIVLIVAFTALVLLFKVQNIDNVTVSLFTLSLTMPLSLLLIGIYVLGMVTGSSVVGLLRESVRGAHAPHLHEYGGASPRPAMATTVATR